MTAAAQLLTDTANRVREAAGKATGVPWVASGSAVMGDADRTSVPYGGVLVAACTATVHGGLDSDADAAYIALMHPGVGRTLADLLQAAGGAQAWDLLPSDALEALLRKVSAVDRALRGDQT